LPNYCLRQSMNKQKEVVMRNKKTKYQEEIKLQIQ